MTVSIPLPNPVPAPRAVGRQSDSALAFCLIVRQYTNTFPTPPARIRPHAVRLLRQHPGPHPGARLQRAGRRDARARAGLRARRDGYLLDPGAPFQHLGPRAAGQSAADGGGSRGAHQEDPHRARRRDHHLLASAAARRGLGPARSSDRRAPRGRRRPRQLRARGGQPQSARRSEQAGDEPEGVPRDARRAARGADRGPLLLQGRHLSVSGAGLPRRQGAHRQRSALCRSRDRRARQAHHLSAPEAEADADVADGVRGARRDPRRRGARHGRGDVAPHARGAEAPAAHLQGVA